MGTVVADLHRDHGVNVRLGVGVVRIEGGTRVERVRLTDGTVLDVDLVVVGIGVIPNTDWLEGSGLHIDNGVVCDDTCRAAPGVVAAGDVARWHNARFGEKMRVEHWDNAVEMGSHSAPTLLSSPHTAQPYTPVPWFWSDQYDRKIQLAGRSGATDEVAIVAGSVEERRFVAFFGRGGRVVGVLGMSMPAKVMRWRAHVDAATPWDQALADARSRHDDRGLPPPGDGAGRRGRRLDRRAPLQQGAGVRSQAADDGAADRRHPRPRPHRLGRAGVVHRRPGALARRRRVPHAPEGPVRVRPRVLPARRSEEHTTELPSLMRISYAVCCLK